MTQPENLSERVYPKRPVQAFARWRAFARQRRPDIPESSKKEPSACGQKVPPLGVIALHRLAYGPCPGDLEAFNALGGDDLSRLTRYVDQQLDPMSLDDQAADELLARADFMTLDKPLEQLWQEHVLDDPDPRAWDQQVLDPSVWDSRFRDLHHQPIREVERSTLLRAVHSKRQLFEVLVDFWHGHFNVLGWDCGLGPLFTHYDRDILRVHALGNFRQLLEAIAQSPIMLCYLDNLNTNAGPNGKYVRELFGRHTLGRQNDRGSEPWDSVPIDSEGFPIGFVDADVREAARCFTGWTIDDSCCGHTGEFSYREDWHDARQKRVLGLSIPADQAPLRDGRDVFDRLAGHPGTARHIAEKLCQRLISDHPPEPVIDAAAAVFRAEAEAPDQIAQVVRTIVLSEEFRTTWGEKTKRPFEILAGALRAAQGRFSYAVGDAGCESLFDRYQHSGHGLFGRGVAAGQSIDAGVRFSANREAWEDSRPLWISHSPRVTCWRLVHWLVVSRDAKGSYRLNVLEQTPANVRTARGLADFWIHRVLGRPMPEGARQEVIEFMAQGYGPDADLPVDEEPALRERLQAMLGLLFISPDFLRR